MERIAITLCVLVALLWPLSAEGFPDNGVLDTFTGTDGANPPNANWTNADIRSGGAGCTRDDNAVGPGATSGFWGCYWNASTFGPDAEAYATIVNIGSTGFGAVCARLTTPGSGTTDGYCVEWADATSQIFIYRVDNEVGTQLGATISQTITTTDKIGISAIGDQICAWFSDSGGAWTQLACRTDGTYTAAGRIGLYLNGTLGVGAMDDFGGGTTASASSNFMLRRRAS